jgi:hypothetical protein
MMELIFDDQLPRTQKRTEAPVQAARAKLATPDRIAPWWPMLAAAALAAASTLTLATAIILGPPKF